MFLVVFKGVGLAESPGIKIIEPKDGSAVNPGQKITITIEVVGGFVPKDIMVVTFFSVDTIASPPFTINLTIPDEASGKLLIAANARDASDEFVGDDITLYIKQTATLLSLKVDRDELFFDVDWNGNIEDYTPYIYVDGIYSDGITRDLSEDIGTTYVSSDPSVVSIDSEGKVKAHKVGQAKITVSNSGVSVDIPVNFRKPRGIPPEETIPPTTKIDIQPTANEAGWHNSDVTVTITATDNEGGSGIQEIIYQLNSLGAGENYVQDDIAKIVISHEGYDRLIYVAKDHERNSSVPHTVEFNLDKTPPQISLQLKPSRLSEDEDEEEEEEDSAYQLLYSADDALSGLKTLKGGLAVVPIDDYKVKLKRHVLLDVKINEKKKRLKIKAPKPDEILTQLRNGLLTFDSGQYLRLGKDEDDDEGWSWKIKETKKTISIKAPSIIFKAKATDVADNKATQQLEFKGISRLKEDEEEDEEQEEED